MIPRAFLAPCPLEDGGVVAVSNWRNGGVCRIGAEDDRRLAVLVVMLLSSSALDGVDGLRNFRLGPALACRASACGNWPRVVLFFKIVIEYRVRTPGVGEVHMYVSSHGVFPMSLTNS